MELLGRGPGLNFDFARLSFHVPAVELLCANPICGGAAATANAVRISAFVVKLLRRSPNGIVSKNQWPAGPRVPGTKSKRVYVRAAFEAAMRAHTRHTAPHLRLVT